MSLEEKFIETKLKADDEHKKHIEHIRQVHDYDKILTGLKQKAREGAQEEGRDSGNEGS